MSVSPITAIVWSKDSCPNCVQAKALLKQHGIVYEERNVGQQWTKEQLLAAVPKARTLPQIFLNNQYIGGLIDLQNHLQG